jgi:hypothetical protein
MPFFLQKRKVRFRFLATKKCAMITLNMSQMQIYLPLKLFFGEFSFLRQFEGHLFWELEFLYSSESDV